MIVGVTGSAGFISGYLVEVLLKKGHQVIGVDNFSKYGIVRKSYDNNPNYKFIKGDVKDSELLEKIFKDCDHLVAGAAKIGGISYFHKFAYDLLSENEKITASTFDAAIKLFSQKRLKKITVISSSMVFESASKFPTPEDAIYFFPPPKSSYGFQKLSTEYFAKAAWEQYKLPYTIVRPFNCVGLGEYKAKTDLSVKSGNINLAMSHVLPDLVQKILKKQDPLHILGNGRQIRHYTFGGDLAEGIYKAIFSKKAINNDFNLSSDKSTTVLQLAKIVWKKINPGKPFRYICDKPFEYDVQKRIPDTSKAKKILNFEATTSLENVVDQMIPWIKIQIEKNRI